MTKTPADICGRSFFAPLREDSFTFSISCDILCLKGVIFVNDTIYTLPEIRSRLTPVFSEYNVNSAVVFGSYAKGCAHLTSDVDILVDSGLKGLEFFGLLEDVSNALDKQVDLLDITQIAPDSAIEREISKSGVRIYG